MTYRILVADDQDDQLRAVVALLKGLDVSIEMATSGADALRQLLASRYDLSLLDMHMPGLTGLEVIGQVQQAGQLVPSILMTGNPSREIEMAAMELGVITMLKKPIPAEVLRITVQRIFSQSPIHPRPAQDAPENEPPQSGEPW
ncbi:MAG: response regulator [Planctomycetota bacterium]|jgi:DNA-binding NtrC family response regulator